MMKVDAIMTREVCSVRPSEPAAHALEYLRSMHVSGAPVPDLENRPVGVVAWNDLVDAPPGALVVDCMSVPPVMVSEGDHVREAARRIAVTGHHRLVVVGPSGHVVGVVSALDVVRALVTMPALP